MLQALGLLNEEAETGEDLSGPEEQPLLAVWSSGSSGLTGLLLLCPGTSPDGPMPAGGDEDEDAEGVAELPEVPLKPQESRSPQQVGRTLRPAKLEPSIGQAQGLGSPTCPKPVLGQRLPCPFPLPAEQLLLLRAG